MGVSRFAVLGASQSSADIGIIGSSPPSQAGAESEDWGFDRALAEASAVLYCRTGSRSTGCRWHARKRILPNMRGPSAEPHFIWAIRPMR